MGNGNQYHGEAQLGAAVQAGDRRDRWRAMGLGHLDGGDGRRGMWYGCMVGLPEEEEVQEDPTGFGARKWKNRVAMH